jgi:hypothetical protein
MCKVGGSFVKEKAALTMRKVLDYEFRIVLSKRNDQTKMFVGLMFNVCIQINFYFIFPFIFIAILL